MYASTKYVYERGPAWAVGPNSNHTRELVLATSVFRAGLVDGALRNAIKLVVFLAWAYGTGTLLLAPALFWASRVRSGRAVLGVVALWTVPMVLFLIVFHIAEPGYVMLLLPAGYAILGAGLQSRFGPRIATRVVIVLALASCAQFLFYPWSPDLPRTGGRLASIRSLVNAKVAYMSASGLRNIDLRDRIHQPGDFWRTGAHDVADGLRATPSSRPD
jgi:hypothetical protein